MRRLVLLCSLALLGVVVPEGDARPADPVPLTAPTVTGEPVFDGVLRAEPGTYADPQPTTLAYRWLRDGDPVRGDAGDDRRYRPGLRDLGHRLSVRVTATDALGSTASTSDETDRVARAELTLRRPPRIAGEQRYTRTVRARTARWSQRPTRVTYRWLRGGERIAGARGPRYRIRPEDVGRRIRLEATAHLAGHRPARAVSPRTRAVRHRVDVRRRVSYVVRTRGNVTVDVGEFARLAQQTYDDPRGWRGAGIDFRRVSRGGGFTLWMAEASTMTSFSSACSVQYSCRVGRNVIINQDRWRYATEVWRRAGESLRDYRHMVVDHETGHWLGLGHAYCPGAGRPAPVMQQQSKGLQGCRANPFPTLGELRSRTPSGRDGARVDVD